MTVTILLLVLKSVLVAATTLLLLRLTRRRSAAERATIAHLGLFALVALPLASLALPQLAVPVPVRLAPAYGAAWQASASRVQPAAESAEDSVPATISGSTPPVRWFSFPAWYLLALPAIALLALTLTALLRLIGLRARAEVLVDPAWLGALARAQRRMGFKSGTALLKSGELASPISWGLMRPTILLDEAAVLAPEQAEAIIAHELAHVVQLDWAKLILARVATAAFWFNPLAWVLAREAHQLREEAADDAVLAADIAGPDYAELLIGVARHQCRGVLLGAHGVAPSRSSLGRRVGRVLDGTLARRPSGRSWVAGFAAGMLTMAVPLAALTVSPGQAARPDASAARVMVDRRASDTTSSNDADAPQTGDEIADRRDIAGSPRAGTSRSAGIDADTLIGLRAVGATPDYAREMLAAGFPSRSAEDLTGARAVGVTPDYVRAMRAARLPLTAEDLIGARATGLDPAYIASLRRLGIEGSFDDYQGMHAVGVTADFVRQLRARGIDERSPDKLTGLRAVGGIDPDP